jgi:RNA polymerase sigma-70 factor, ECF subfamily
MTDNQTAVLQRLIDRMRRGDDEARRELIDRAYERLRHLSAVILRRSFPRLRRAPALVDTTDVANESAYRLYQALAEIQPATVRDFFRLAAKRIRWLLLDLAKQADRAGQHELDARRAAAGHEDSSAAGPPMTLTVLYRQIELLPENERDVLDLLYFHGLTQAETAAMLGVTERTVRRQWTDARARLYEALKEARPADAGLIPLDALPIRTERTQWPSECGAPSLKPNDSTSLSLLGKVADNDRDAWQRLVTLYSPLVCHWCRQGGLQGDEIQDVVQEVFAAVATSLKTYQIDRPSVSFRGWMRGIARHKLLDYLRRRPSPPEGGTDALRRLNEIPGPTAEHDLSEDDGEIHRLYRRALDLVRVQFEDKTWKAFWLVVIENRSPIEVASELGMTPNSVRQAKSRVLRRVKDEVGELIT